MSYSAGDGQYIKVIYWVEKGMGIDSANCGGQLLV